MEAISISATDRTPEILFDFSAGVFRMAGEAYPEDTARFFIPLHQALREYLQSKPAHTKFELELQYFNSSSAKALMNMFMLLDDAAAEGLPIEVQWHYYTDDDTILEFGEDFAADCRTLKIELCGRERETAT